MSLLSDNGVPMADDGKMSRFDCKSCGESHVYFPEVTARIAKNPDAIKFTSLVTAKKLHCTVTGERLKLMFKVELVSVELAPEHEYPVSAKINLQPPIIPPEPVRDVTPEPKQPVPKPSSLPHGYVALSGHGMRRSSRHAFGRQQPR